MDELLETQLEPGIGAADLGREAEEAERVLAAYPYEFEDDYDR